MKRTTDLRSGFSLIEVLVVITIIASFIGVIVANMSGSLAEHNLNAVVDAVGLEIQAARTEAVTTGHELLMKYDPEKNRLRLERIPDVDVIEFLSEPKDERRRAYLKEDGELVREYVFDSKVVDFRGVFVDGKVHDRVVAIFFGPDGTTEPHRLLFIDAENEDNKIALEYRGFQGRLKEMDPEQFPRDFEELDEEIPAVIKDEDFFDASTGLSTPNPDGGPEGSDDDSSPYEGSN